MIDQYSEDGTGWARFSDDMTMRYRLGRVVGEVRSPEHVKGAWEQWSRGHSPLWRRVVFLMLNPSTADAFVLDPTIKRCVSFARAMGADALEVVNIFALRSTDPDQLHRRTWGLRGDDQENNNAIITACTGAIRVVAGWGKHGALDHRGDVVRSMLAAGRISLSHLGTNKDGSPKHPLYLKGGTEPQLWSTP